MTLHPGARLGPYEITGSLGSGGMGEVYRANDSRLRREVAIKISGESFSDRFEREARAIAALNHPNICTLHDVGPDFLVMELVEGPTLAERLSDGPIPLDQALDIALQIAHALEAAHEKGIVHRDLKPANIKIRADGTVKVLDFGLAKAFGSDGAGPSAAMALDNSPTVLGPTISAGVTGLGAIVGTSAYMAPEQAKGTAVDKRADIWAFGVVLWEMITGRRLFAGDSISETLAGVLTSEPDLTAIPPNVRRLLRSCLEKDPRRRLHDISDARLLLDSAPALETPPAPAKRRWVPWATAALMTAALAGTNAFWLTRPAPERRTSRFSLTAPSGTQFAAHTTAAVSPDGRHVVFVAVSQSGRSLWLQSLESATARPLPFGEDANWPSWSPDSRSLVFVNGASGQIKRADISGDAPQPLVRSGRQRADGPRGMEPGRRHPDGVDDRPVPAARLRRRPAAIERT